MYLLLKMFVPLKETAKITLFLKIRKKTTDKI